MDLNSGSVPMIDTMPTDVFSKCSAFPSDLFFLLSVADLMQPCKADFSVLFIIFTELQ